MFGRRVHQNAADSSISSHRTIERIKCCIEGISGAGVKFGSSVLLEVFGILSWRSLSRIILVCVPTV